MPDAAILDASNKLIEAGILGAVLVFVVIALAWVVRQWLSSHALLLKEKDSRLEDAKRYSDVVQANETTMRAMVETFRDRSRAS